MKKVSVVSDLCADLLIKGNVTPRYNQEEQLVDDYLLELGGSAAIFASQLAKLGGDVTLYGLVGEDLFGEFLVDRLTRMGVTPKIRRSGQVRTSLGLGLVRGNDRAMLTHDAAMRTLQPDEIFSETFFNVTNHLHICSYFLLPQFQYAWPQAIARVKSRGGTVSLDTNWAPAGDWERVRGILSEVDVFLPNEQEAIRISGKQQLEEAGEWLSAHCSLVVIKCGADGARVFSPGKSWHFQVPEILTKALEIADTTGAGDNFDAGFIRAWLNGLDLESCVQLGLRCGTMSLREIGGINGQVKEADD